ncbi:hypothetical protein OAQ45_02365, partial [Candidatus Marinimicrobia bacterium]|nr:hypothetical protein [Candidatus Neomarinimicrobiota bacterium]
KTSNALLKAGITETATGNASNAQNFATSHAIGTEGNEIASDFLKIGTSGFNKGGVVYADKGTLVNYQPKGTDTVPAMLTPGEFVVRKSSVDKYGAGMMKAINAGNFERGGEAEEKAEQLLRLLQKKADTTDVYKSIDSPANPLLSRTHKIRNRDDNGSQFDKIGHGTEAFRGFPTRGEEAKKHREEISDKNFARAVAGGFGYANNTGLMDLDRKNKIKERKEEKKQEIDAFLFGGRGRGRGMTRRRAIIKMRRLELFNNGGPVSGGAGIDANPAMLTRGEYVINKQSAQSLGTNNLNRLNSIKGYNEGGPVGYFAKGGPPSSPSRSQLLFNQSQPKADLDTSDFSSSINKLVGDQGFGAFSQAVNKFEELPKEFTMTLAPTNVTVTLNGAELLAQMMPIIQKEALNAVAGKIEGLKQELKSGDV